MTDSKVGGTQLQRLNELVSRYERGQLPRRDFLGALAAMTYAIPPPPAAAIPARGITHVNIRVRDVEESEQFYRQLFDLPPAREIAGAAFALDLPGGGFISLCPLSNPDCSLKQTPVPGEIDHFGIGVDGFKQKVTASRLEEHGLETLDAGSSVFIKDPNGAWVQVSAPKESFDK